MNKYDDKREQQINALLDGELDKAAADALKSAATDDRELARAIIEAYQLQQAMDGIHVERAPVSLRKRLRAIPRKRRTAPGIGWFQPRWVIALAAIPLVIVALSVMQPNTPSASEIANARQQLAVAFAYLDKAGVMTGRRIEQTVGYTMADAITGSVNSVIKLHHETSREKEA